MLHEVVLGRRLVGGPGQRICGVLGREEDVVHRAHQRRDRLLEVERVLAGIEDRPECLGQAARVVVVARLRLRGRSLRRLAAAVALARLFGRTTPGLEFADVTAERLLGVVEAVGGGAEESQVVVSGVEEPARRFAAPLLLVEVEVGEPAPGRGQLGGDRAGGGRGLGEVCQPARDELVGWEVGLEAGARDGPAAAVVEGRVGHRRSRPHARVRIA